MADETSKEIPAITELSDKALDGVVGGSFANLPSKGKTMSSADSSTGSGVNTAAGDHGTVIDTKPPKDPLFPGPR